MKFSKEEIEEFKELYKQHRGEEISDQEAYNQASSLLRLIEVVYNPNYKNNKYFNEKL